MQPEALDPFTLTDAELQSFQTPDIIDPGILTAIDEVLASGHPRDGLEARMSSDDEEDALVLLIQDWRTLSPEDPKGELLQTRVTSAIARKIDVLIERTRREIWQTRSDFMREAIWTYIRSVVQALQTNDPTLLTMITEAELAGRAHFHNTRRHKLEQAVADMANYLTDLVNLDDHEEAHRTLMETAVRLRRMHVPAWKRQWLVSLNSLPILKIVVRVLDKHGWDIPLEFTPATGKTTLSLVLATTAPAIPVPVPAPAPTEETTPP
jgi:hypothetical protein